MREFHFNPKSPPTNPVALVLFIFGSYIIFSIKL